MKNFLETAIRLCRGHEYSEHLDFNLCAIVVRGGAILSVGYNRFGSSELVQCFSNPSSNYNRNVHAEADAIIKIRKTSDLNGSKIYVARVMKKVGPNGEYLLGLAAPCEMCEEILRAYGIGKAFFTINNDSYGVKKIKKR
jgi:deoxycytidylate deaminase